MFIFCCSLVLVAWLSRFLRIFFIQLTRRTGLRLINTRQALFMYALLISQILTYMWEKYILIIKRKVILNKLISYPQEHLFVPSVHISKHLWLFFIILSFSSSNFILGFIILNCFYAFICVCISQPCVHTEGHQKREVNPQVLWMYKVLKQRAISPLPNNRIIKFSDPSLPYLGTRCQCLCSEA